MSLLRSVSLPDNESRELILSAARNLISIVGALYLAWHFVATLAWPKIFSPSLWVSTLMMLLIVILSLSLLERYYLVSQVVWLGGLVATIAQAYVTYEAPEVLILLVLLPVMAVVTLGVNGTLVVVLSIIGLMSVMPHLWWVPPLPPGYVAGIVLGSVFMGFFGWGLSSNLLSAIDAASYHFSEARHLLEETRQHRAEISRMLKDRNQANYQLERLNQMLHFARKRAEEARVDRDRFVLAVSHELRSPLNFILGFSDLMVNSPDTYAPLKEWPVGLYDDVQEIYHSSRHLLGLINDILDMGQIDAQQMVLFRELVFLDEIMEEVSRIVATAFDQKGLYLRYEVEPNLPQVSVDRTRLRQVLLNLVNNSLRFTEQGGVTIALQQMEGALQVSVADTGSGIADEDIPKVFDEFRQVGVDRWRRREGSGLGLSISRRFVELHGGKMWLESEQGMGTKFFFTIPLQASAMLEPQPTESDRWREPGSGHQPLVLLLTENSAVLQIAQGWLPDYQLIVVARAEELLSRVAQHLPHAVLVDQALLDQQRLPLRELPYDLPVISLVFPVVKERAQALPAGVAHYLVKPVARQTLVEAVKELASQSEEIFVQRLLVVDDDPAMLRFVMQAFRAEILGQEVSPSDGEMEEDQPSQGYQIITAQTAQEALDLLREQAVDVLLLDLDLPDLSGWEMLAQIRQGQTLSQPRVVIISALDLPQNLLVYGQAVLDIRMKRPLSATELGEVLKPILDSVQPVYPVNKQREDWQQPSRRRSSSAGSSPANRAA